MAKDKKMDSLNIEGQFRDNAEFYMMLVDGSCYRFVYNNEVSFEPITRSFYGHVLKMVRKKALRQMANLYFKRNLAKKSKNFVMVNDYTGYIADQQKVVDNLNSLWSTFRIHITRDKKAKRMIRVMQKGIPTTYDDWKARQ